MARKVALKPPMAAGSKAAETYLSMRHKVLIAGVLLAAVAVGFQLLGTAGPSRASRASAPTSTHPLLRPPAGTPPGEIPDMPVISPLYNVAGSVPRVHWRTLVEAAHSSEFACRQKKKKQKHYCGW